MLGKQSQRRELSTHSLAHTAGPFGMLVGSVRMAVPASTLMQGTGEGVFSPLSLGKWKLWSSSKPLASAKMKDQSYKPNKGLPGVQGKW